MNETDEMLPGMGEFTTESIENRLRDVENELETVNESYGDAIRQLMAFESAGFEIYGWATGEHGFTLGQLTMTARELRERTDTNSLLKRGLEIRCSFMFGTGYEIETGDKTVSKRIQDIIDDQVNQDIIFSQDALTINEHARYCDGWLGVAYNKITNRFQRIPLWQISEFVTNPENDEQIWYYKRSWTSQIISTAGELTTQENNYWYITDRAVSQGAPIVGSIQGIPVDPKYILVDDHVNRRAGATLGIPDAFTAAPWAISYSNYLRDGTKYLASLAQWAWQIAPKTTRGAANAATRVKTAHSAGNTLISDMDIKSLGTANAIDLTTGRPLAAQVAAALGVDLVVLLSDAGDTVSQGPLINAADPMVKTMLSRQRQNSSYIERCLTLVGVKNGHITWGKMTPDADYREQQTVIAAVGTGLFHPDEIRDRVASLAGIKIKHDKPPKGYMTPNNKNSFTQIDAQYQGQAGPNGTELAAPTPVSGGVPSAGGSTIKTDGTTELTNGQGKASKINVKAAQGTNDLRGTGGRA